MKWKKHVFFVNRFINLVGRVSANEPGDRASIPGRVIPKTQKVVLDDSLLNTQHYKVRIKGKLENRGKTLVSSPTPRCSHVAYPKYEYVKCSYAEKSRNTDDFL